MKKSKVIEPPRKVRVTTVDFDGHLSHVDLFYPDQFTGTFTAETSINDTKIRKVGTVHVEWI